MRPIWTIALAAIASAQQPTIRVPVRVVAQRALVFSAGNRLLPDLPASDFIVLDNGHAQRIRLDPEDAPVSLAVAIQTSREVRDFLPFLAKAGGLLDALLVGETGEAAVLTYADEVRVVKAFGAGDTRPALRDIAAAGRDARLLDAAARAIALLDARPPSRARVLLLVGEPGDTGSESDLESVRRAAEQANIAVYALALPVAGKAFVSDTFSLSGVTFAERGGFRAGADLGSLVHVLSRTAARDAGADPFTVLTSATGGAQFHVRTQKQFEGAVAALGVQLRSGYVLSYSPAPADPGYHTVSVQVAIPGAKVFTRPGYRLPE